MGPQGLRPALLGALSQISAHAHQVSSQTLEYESAITVPRDRGDPDVRYSSCTWQGCSCQERKILASEVLRFLLVILGFFVVARFFLFVVYQREDSLPC